MAILNVRTDLTYSRESLVNGFLGDQVVKPGPTITLSGLDLPVVRRSLLRRRKDRISAEFMKKANCLFFTLGHVLVALVVAGTLLLVWQRDLLWWFYLLVIFPVLAAFASYRLFTVEGDVGLGREFVAAVLFIMSLAIVAGCCLMSILVSTVGEHGIYCC